MITPLPLNLREPCRRRGRKVIRDSELSQGNGLSWAWQYTERVTSTVRGCV